MQQPASPESVFTYGAPQLKYGPGSSDEIGYDLSTYDVRRVLVVTDPGVAATGHPQRVADQMAAFGIEAEVYDGARVEPTDASLQEAVDHARATGPWDAFVAVGGGTAIDTAKAVDLLYTNPGELIDYVNKPVGGGRAPRKPLAPLVAVPTTTGTGSESTTICVLDVVAQKVKTGISHPRLRPTLAVVDPRLTTTQPPGVTAAAGMDILCHALESWTARPYHAFSRRRPEERVPYCGANPIADMWAEKALRLLAGSFRTAVRHGDDEAAREQMSLAATFAGMGFGNAGVHIPHANAYPIAGRVRDFHPKDYPDEHPMVPHGMAVALTAPEAFRFTFDADPDRHVRAAEMLAPGADRPDDLRDYLPRVLTDLMRDIHIPNGLAEVGYSEGDVPDLVEGTLKQQRLLATAPKDVTADDLAAILRASLESPGERTIAARARRPGPAVTVPEVVAELHRAGVTDVDASTLARALYSSDASLYRVPPLAVVRPRHVDELLAVVETARATGTPVTMRGAGTSIAGNAVGPGLVVDTRRHLGRVRSIDPEAGTAEVDPGVVHADLQRAAAPHGLRFGPDPSTHTRCTVGGMIGNNACGSRALGYGRTSDNVVALDVVTGAGERVDTAKGGSAVGAAFDELVAAHLATIRTDFGRFPRQVSGYALEHLLPENGRRLDRFLVGSEGTLAVVLGATVRLVRDQPHRALAVLGYASMFEAADAVPGLLQHPLVACEGLDHRIVEVVRAQGGTVPDLPRGRGWLFAEVTGDTLEETVARARAVVADAGAVDARVVTEPGEQAPLWRIREDGAGLAARSLARPAHAGWEDAAVPPERLGAYLRDFDALLRQHDLDGVPYGHFGDGCVHVRIDFRLRDPGGPAEFRRFLEEAARLVASYGGTLSGEHGDGRARSSLLGLMYSPDVLDLFGRVKAVCDPDRLLNPGVLVDPAPAEADLRLAGPLRQPSRGLRWAHDGGSVVEAVHRCTGVGKCTAAPNNGVMCPSYEATREEKDSTRGRARVLQEMVDGRLVKDGWRSPEVHEALDLCLACKGCSRDCPTGIDMATYKAEALHQRYRGRPRPRSHYALGALPRWLRLSPSPALAARLLSRPLVQRVAKAAAGVDRRRSIPVPARQRARALLSATGAADAPQPDVVLWADTFTEHFTPEHAAAAVEVLRDAGYTVGFVEEPACCGLTWFSTGQLDAARRQLRRTLDVLHDHADRGVRIVALEPSCLATLRSDLGEVLDDPRAATVVAQTRTLAEVLAEADGWTPPDLTGVEVVAQPHCHHHSVLGWEADAALLARTGATVSRVAGCCGLAGNFGVEQGHYEVSVAVAETHLLPAVRRAGPGAVVLADGFSCRTQLDDLAGVGSLHLAELLARGGRAGGTGEIPYTA